jgi:putative SOS response-associated peptidase YedK
VKGAKNRPWYFFQPRDDAPLFLGAVVKPEGFSILTQAPLEPVASIHDRSPVLVPADDVMAWLSPDVAGPDALRRLAASPTSLAARLKCWRVSDAAKNAANDGPELIAWQAERRELF